VPVRKTQQRVNSAAAVRLFFVDQKTGNPVAGIAVSIVEDSPNKGQVLAMLQTDKAGYVSFKLDRSTVAAVSQLRIVYPGSKEDSLVLTISDLLAGTDTYTIRLDASALDASAPPPGLPAVTSPDIVDLTLSPNSIGLIPHLNHRWGLCHQLMPTTLSVRRFNAIQIVADICKLDTISCNELVQFTSGKMLEYEIAWHSAGTSLGDLLNTITLAPCEQVNVAVIDWMRREATTLDQTSSVQQQATQRMDHDRLVAETMQSAITSQSSATALGVTAGLSFSLQYTHLAFNITAGFGYGTSSTTTTQTAAVATTNQLSEHIAQASSFVASQRGSSVYQTTAMEHETYQTRTIRNHNHCHTLNVMYYQVNRNYKVITDYKGQRDVILVKYNNDGFDSHKAYCNAEILEGGLLDPDLRSCFDALGDVLFCCGRGIKEQGILMDAVTLAINGTDKNVQLLSILLNTGNGPITIQANGASLAPGAQQTFNLPALVDPAQVQSVVLFTSGGGSASRQFANDIEVTYHAVGYSGSFALASAHTSTPIESAVSLVANAGLPPVSEGQNPCVQEACCVQKLLAHLNCHKRYYNSLIWLNEDPNERVMRWSCCQQKGGPYNLISQIVNDPIAVYGDFVVFAAAGSQLVDDPSILPVSRLVTLPTPGVFSEGILGHCNTCEVVDPNTNWDWQSSPCPDNAPTVGTPPAHQTSAAATSLKPDAVTSLVTFASVPSAPESGIKDLIKTLIDSADKGSAEASKLLTDLLDKVKASIPKSS